MKILVLGTDGYLGWPVSLYLLEQGYEVHGIDCFLKRAWETRSGVKPLIPLDNMRSRLVTANEHRYNIESFADIDIAMEPDRLYKQIGYIKPDAIVHLAEQPSAPYSMLNRSQCVETQMNNVVGTLNLLFAIKSQCPECHLVKLGTMGEYGTPNIDIEEGWLDVEHNGRFDRVLYPKKPGSFYHLSKVHDSANLEFACRIWDLAVTDLNQGVVWGVDPLGVMNEAGMHTSFHYDSIFGTVINRFVVESVLGEPLTVYGNGTQTRGFIHIMDTLRCIELAIEHPAAAGEFRVFNQFTEQFSLNDLALKIIGVNGGTAARVENPRIEQQDHYYNAKNDALLNLGLVPHYLTDTRIEHMIDYVEKYKHLVQPKQILPEIKWRAQ